MVDYKKGYKLKDEEDVRLFLSEKLNRPIGNGPLQPLLLNGLLLCELIENISSNIRLNKNENKNTFAYHDNIGQFLTYAEKLSIPQAELFQTVDLVEGKSMQSVFSCILAIKRKIEEKPLLTKSKKTGEPMLHKQNFPTQSQQEFSSKVGFKKNGVINKSTVSDNNGLKYASAPIKTKKKNQVATFKKDKINQCASNKVVTTYGAVRSKIEIYNQPVEPALRKASMQLYLSKSSETEKERLKSKEEGGDEADNSSTFLKVSKRAIQSVEKQHVPKKKEDVQNFKKSGSNDTMLSVENKSISLKSSRSTPLVVSDTIEKHPEMDYKINTAACRKASLKQMGTKSVTVIDDDDRETVYALGGIIGKGQFGEVFGGLNMTTSEYVAIKRIRRNDMDCDDMTEVDFLKYLDSEHIVQYKGYSKDKEFLNIVLEYVEMGSLRTNIRCFGKFPENLAASHTYKILSGLKYLHDKMVIHCDLKAANILITKTGCLKLTDFGVSLFSKMKDDDTGEPNGTPNWMAPEVIKFNRPTEKSDIWSLGCTVVEMLTGKPPYSNMMSFAVLFKIVEDDTLPIPENISEDARDFLLCCFQKDPKNRSTATELMQHKWLRHAVTSTRVVNGTKIQNSKDLFSAPKKVSRKEVKKDFNNTSKTPLLAKKSLYQNKLYNNENNHQFYTTSTSKSMGNDICLGSLKIISEGEKAYCKDCYDVYHNSCAMKVAERCRSYNQTYKSELFKPFKNPIYSDSRRNNV